MRILTVNSNIYFHIVSCSCLNIHNCFPELVPMSSLAQTFCEKRAQVLAHTCAYAYMQTSCMAHVRSAQRVRRAVAASFWAYAAHCNGIWAFKAAFNKTKILCLPHRSVPKLQIFLHFTYHSQKNSIMHSL